TGAGASPREWTPQGGLARDTPRPAAHHAPSPVAWAQMLVVSRARDVRRERLLRIPRSRRSATRLHDGPLAEEHRAPRRTANAGAQRSGEDYFFVVLFFAGGLGGTGVGISVAV